MDVSALFGSGERNRLQKRDKNYYVRKSRISLAEIKNL